MGLIILLFLAIIPAYIASQKGYSGAGFYFFGLLLFLPGLIVAICLPDKREDARREESVRQELRGLKRELASVKSSVEIEKIDPVCKSCGKENEGSKFCKTCGAALETVRPAAGGAVCYRCGHAGTADDEYCGSCGAPLKRTAEKPLEPVPVRVRDGRIVCPSCHASQMENRDACWKCGVPFVKR